MIISQTEQFNEFSPDILQKGEEKKKKLYPLGKKKVLWIFPLEPKELEYS